VSYHIFFCPHDEPHHIIGSGHPIDRCAAVSLTERNHWKTCAYSYCEDSHDTLLRASNCSRCGTSAQSPQEKAMFESTQKSPEALSLLLPYQGLDCCQHKATFGSNTHISSCAGYCRWVLTSNQLFRLIMSWCSEPSCVSSSCDKWGNEKFWDRMNSMPSKYVFSCSRY
jgi:hypothetical protein